MQMRLFIPREHARVDDLNASLEAVLANNGVSRAIQGDVRLIVEELASNAIAYGGGGDVDMGQHELSVDISREADLLTLRFRDQGAPFDPLSAQTPDLEADILDRPIGGLGLYLIRQIAESMHYERIDDCNLLRVSLRVPAPENPR